MVLPFKATEVLNAGASPSQRIQPLGPKVLGTFAEEVSMPWGGGRRGWGGEGIRMAAVWSCKLSKKSAGREISRMRPLFCLPCKEWARYH